MTLLKRLRKYRRTLTGAMLPVLAFVWVGVAASPCAAMRAGNGAIPTMDHGDTAVMGHDDTPAMGHHDTPAMGHHDAPAMGHHDAPAMDHDGMMPMGRGSEHGSTHPQQPCPHCPPSQDHTVPHSACASLSAFLSSDSFAAPAYDLSHALPVAGLLALQEDPAPDEKRRWSGRSQDRSPHVPLNLRYCVFLN